MEIPANTLKLRSLMQAHRLKPEEVGELVGRSRQSVKIWFCNHERTIPDQLLELLELKLKARGAHVQ